MRPDFLSVAVGTVFVATHRTGIPLADEFRQGLQLGLVVWAIGAVASASALHAVGRGFESLIAHHPAPPSLLGVMPLRRLSMTHPPRRTWYAGWVISEV